MRVLDSLIHTSPSDLYCLVYRRLFKKIALSSFDDLHPCVFVLSTGRVGTMSLARLLKLANNIYATHEPYPKLYKLSKACYQVSNELSELSESVFWSVREDIIKKSLNMGRGYIETSPQGTFLAPIILRSIPSVRFIHLIRHPADVVTSGMRRNWYGGHHADSTRITPATDSKFHYSWSESSQFEKNAWLWMETNRWILEFLSSVPDRQKITIRAESLYSISIDEINKVFKFVGADMPLKKSILKVMSKKYNQQTKGSHPRFKDWSPREIEQLRRISGELASSLGYEI